MGTKHVLSEEKIRMKIQEQHESLREFAYRCRISPERLSSILTGLRHGYAVTEATARRIADGLGVGIEDLRDSTKTDGGKGHE